MARPGGYPYRDMSDERLLDFSRAAADAIRSALPLAEFLRSRGLTAAAEAVSRGEPLHLSLAGKFPPLFVAMVRAGEESGKLDSFLDRYSASLETRIDFRRRLSRALAYQLFAVAIAAGVFVLFTAKAAPLLLLPLSQAGVTLPPAALRVLGFGDWLSANWILLLGGTIGGLVILFELAGSKPGRKLRATAGRVLPGLRYITQEERACELEATLGLLLGAGLRPRETFEVLLQTAEEDPLLRRRLARGAALLPQGAGFVECVSPSLPEEDRSRFATAEKAGRLDETLAKLAESHREKHLHRLKAAALSLQLASVVALAPLCFALVMSVVWPALASLRSVGQQASAFGGAAAPGPELPPVAAPNAPVSRESAAASRFNETHAAGVLGFMNEHAAEPSKTESAGDEPAADKPAKKKWKPPKLKTGNAMQRPQFQKIRSTTVRSQLD